ncbi:MAG: hypothetical protein LBF89_02720 [Bacteroidales bacterium]|jgi:hypothetical protein|nr:hypothetical protein [Bacteroidales bacterium]
MNRFKNTILVIPVILAAGCAGDDGLTPVVPTEKELGRAFGKKDELLFKNPSKVYYPETWFHFIGGNVSREGITADLEAIAGAGISGVQLFHGQFGGEWPGVKPQITCLSPSWDEVVGHTAQECRRLGLRFTMQNCPGWAMSGGPWIESSNAMRHLAWSRTDTEGGRPLALPLPVPHSGKESWRDYRDIAVLAFPTPQDDTDRPLQPQSVRSNRPELPWKECLSGQADAKIRLAPASPDQPNWVEVAFPDAVPLRTIEFSSVNGFNHAWCYVPGVTVTVQAILPGGEVKEILQTELPQSNSQDDRPLSLACSEIPDVKTYRISIVNLHDMSVASLRLFSAARKNSWESEAGWTLRSIMRTGAPLVQSPAAYVRREQVLDLSQFMDAHDTLKWDAPVGKWTVLRIGHVNTGQRNAPAPPEGTGWECDKLSPSGPDAHFAGYIGRLADGPLHGGLLNGMLMDSWECKTQTWTTDMEQLFARRAGYPLRQWLPAVFGYVLNTPDSTARFLLDWRGNIGRLLSDNFYGRMAELAHDKGLAVTCETAAGDVFPADILEYFKHADVPMCEFWQPIGESFVGSINFKPVKPTVSAARLYGKPRIAAEAFTSFELTWNEHLQMLKETANINSVEGVTHLVFHTYTHNPRTDFLPPGTSFGTNIGTPFLRGQVWWKYMPALTDYLARCSFMLERGKPVSDVLWYLGDEINHKPDQNAPFPPGFKYDYCNPDVLLHRLSVRDGKIVTPEGVSYRILWMPDNLRMLPQTLEKLRSLIRDGATVVGDAPAEPATLSGGLAAQRRFDAAVRDIWGEAAPGVRKMGKGTVVSGMSLDSAMRQLEISPDVTGEGALWMHRKTKNAEWYFVCTPKGKDFHGTLSFRNNGDVEIWNPVNGEITSPAVKREGKRTAVLLRLPEAGSCFVVFRHTDKPSVTIEQVSEGETPLLSADLGMSPSGGALSCEITPDGKGVIAWKSGTFTVQRSNALQQTVKADVPAAIPLKAPWELAFSPGWGAPSTLRTATLKAWKDLDVSKEAKAYSGTVQYATTFDVDEWSDDLCFILDLGRVEMIADVSVNGKRTDVLWASPYRTDISAAVQKGRNTLTVEVTGTWFNRLVYDAAQPQDNRKTWTIAGPPKEKALVESGLLGPVVLHTGRKIY